MTFAAHNAKGYDTWLVHEQMVHVLGKYPRNMVLAGQKIMFMKTGTVHWINSMNHAMGSLDSMVRTFSLDKEHYSKTFFPYRFNTKENETYIGPVPA